VNGSPAQPITGSRVELAKVSKTYTGMGEDKHVLDEVSAVIQPGQFVSIVGPSGVGKTTLLRLLTGLIPASSGEIILDGTKVDGPPRGLAVVMQEYTRSLMPWLTVEANVGLPIKLDRQAAVSKDERAQRVAEALEEVGLAGNEKRFPWQLSGGMQQRVAIARALASRPSLLVMDEPFASVDAQTRLDLEDLVLKVRDDFGITTVLVTHDMDEAVYLADRVIVLAGKPARVAADITVDLPFPRNQIETREDPRFSHLRSEIYQLIRR
jgi:NitT/TauT family transport system ATP-binding protein